MRSKERDKLLTDKLNFIVEDYIVGGAEELAIKTFGYERQNAISNMSSNNSRTSVIRKVHMESIERRYQIPVSIWNHNVPMKKSIIWELIYEYRLKLKQQEREKKEYLKYQDKEKH